MNNNSTYFRTTVVSGLALVAQLGLGLAVIALLAKLMPKEQFGYFIVSLTGVQLLASVIATSVERTALYIISSNKNNAAAGQKGQLVVAAALIGAGGTALLYLFLASVRLFEWGPAWDWVLMLSPLVIVTCIRTTINACLRAEQKTTQFALLEYGAPPVFRFVLVGLVAMGIISSTPPVVALIFIISAAVPALIAFPFLSSGFFWPRSVVVKENVKYGLGIMLTKLTAESNKALDVVLVGALVTPTMAADYGLASRIANALALLKQAIDSLLVPRIGALYAEGNQERLLGEYSRARDFSFAALLLAASAFCLLGPVLFEYLGEFATGYTVALILTAAAVVRIGVGSTGNYLNMTGRPGLCLLTSTTGLIVLIIGILLLVPLWGGIGGAFAVMFSQISMQGLAVIIVRNTDGISLVSPSGIISLFLAVGILILVAMNQLGPLALTVVFITLVLWRMFPHRETLSRIVRS